MSIPMPSLGMMIQDAVARAILATGCILVFVFAFFSTLSLGYLIGSRTNLAGGDEHKSGNLGVGFCGMILAVTSFVECRFDPHLRDSLPLIPTLAAWLLRSTVEALIIFTLLALVFAVVRRVLGATKMLAPSEAVVELKE